MNEGKAKVKASGEIEGLLGQLQEKEEVQERLIDSLAKRIAGILSSVLPAANEATEKRDAKTELGKILVDRIEKQETQNIFIRELIERVQL